MTGWRAVSAIEVADSYEFFLGTWLLERRFADHCRRERGRFAGTVTVAPSALAGPRVADYSEAGELRLGAYRGDGRRRLRLIGQQGGAAALTFVDGRPFVECDLASGECRATHRCGDDRYELSWQVLSADALSERWHVEGPHKQYDAWAVLRRTAAPSRSHS